MDTIKTLLFEDPTAIYVGAIFAELILAVLWLKLHDRRLVYVAVAPAVLALASGLTARLVVTDRERVRQSLQELAAAIQNRDPDAVGRLIDPDYNNGTYTRASFMERAEMTLRRFDITKVQVVQVTIQTQDDQATVTMRANVQTAIMGDNSDWQTDWLLVWRRHGGRQWLLQSATLTNPKVPMAPGQPR